jgi:oxygen-dependent protoporphyrinogen oxidase
MENQMGKRDIRITILGAGISGLATAHWLHRDGFDVTVLEAGEQPGGSMVTREEAGYLVDCGPNSGLDTTPLIRRLVEEVGLENDLMYANDVGGRRYIVRRGRLHPLPTGPGAFLKTGLFSVGAKCRLLAEPFIGKSDDGYYQSIADFVRRRLGREFLDYAINPFVSGVYAGDPEKLSVKSAFPKLYRLEEVYGGLIKGMIKGARERKTRRETSKQHAKMFSFSGGMQSFPRAIADVLGDRVRYGCEVQKVTRSGSGWRITCRIGKEMHEIESDMVVSAIPAHRAASIFQDLDPRLAQHLKSIYYPPVKLLFLGYRQSDVGRPLDGFGYLIPAREEKSFLGAIWSSTLFPGRAPKDAAAFTLFVGGARFPGLFDVDSEALNRTVLTEFSEIMSIQAPPVFSMEYTWPRAIPQYTLGYIEHERYFQEFEIDHPGLFLSGNYRGGISVGDCIIQSDLIYRKISGIDDKGNNLII